MISENIIITSCVGLVDYIDEKLAENVPELIIENDGIGAYEYWGAKCFDHGNDYLVPNEDSLELVINLPYAKRLLNKIVNYMNYEKYTSYVSATMPGKYDDNYVRINYIVKNITVKNHSLILDIEWQDVEY